MSKISIAIDGPAGAGKSEVSSILADKLGFIHLDTGALYRTVAYYFVNSNGIINEELVNKEISKISVDIKFLDKLQLMYLNKENVTDKIRNMSVSKIASDISSFRCVREFLLDIQRNLAKSNNIIMDGRDISTVVLPNANVKIFLTASAEERARRRMNQLKQKGIELEYNEILNSINLRDKNDSTRSIAPLKPSKDSEIFDTTNQSINEVVTSILNYIKKKINVI